MTSEMNTNMSENRVYIGIGREVYRYRISSNRGPGLYFFHEIFDPASKRGWP